MYEMRLRGCFARRFGILITFFTIDGVMIASFMTP